MATAARKPAAKVTERKRAVQRPLGMSARKWEIAKTIAAEFAVRGFHAVSMRDLAEELNLNPGTLYHHFPSKDHALLTICLVGLEKAFDEVKVVLERYDTFPERFRALLEEHLKSLDEYGDFIDVFSSQREFLPDSLTGPIRQGWTEMRDCLYGMFRQAAAKGEVAADIDERNALRMLLDINRTSNTLYRIGRKHEAKPFTDFAANVFLKGVSPS